MLEMIASAIKAKQVLRVSYDPGSRLIEPHCLGFGRAGQPLLRAYQFSGASRSEPDDWKLLRVDRIEDIEFVGKDFAAARSRFNPRDPAMSGGIIASL